MVERPKSEQTRSGDEVETVDRQRHGEPDSSGIRRSLEGAIRTQRGDPSDLAPEIVALGYEPLDASARGVSFTILGLVGALMLSLGLVFAYLSWLQHVASRPPVSPMARTLIRPPAPRLQVDPLPERAAIEEKGLARLRAYARLADDPTRSRIPIARAMELLADHGWPDADEPPALQRLPGSAFASDRSTLRPEPVGRPTENPLMPVEQRPAAEATIRAPP